MLLWTTNTRCWCCCCLTGGRRRCPTDTRLSQHSFNDFNILVTFWACRRGSGVRGWSRWWRWRRRYRWRCVGCRSRSKGSVHPDGTVVVLLVDDRQLFFSFETAFSFVRVKSTPEWLRRKIWAIAKRKYRWTSFRGWSWTKVKKMLKLALLNWIQAIKDVTKPLAFSLPQRFTLHIDKKLLDRRTTWNNLRRT